MSAPLPRRLARALARWADSLLPPHHASWGEAMRREVEHIEDDRAALSWAMGALWAAGGTLLGSRWAARGLALLAFLQALNMLFAPILIIAWHMRWLGVEEFLGGQLPGDHYERFVPLMNATSPWQTALWIAAGLLFLVSMLHLLRHRHGAFAIFVVALTLTYASSCAGWIDRELHPALAEIYRHTYAFPRSNWRRDYLIPAAQKILPIIMAAVLWWRERIAPRPIP